MFLNLCSKLSFYWCSHKNMSSNRADGLYCTFNVFLKFVIKVKNSLFCNKLCCFQTTCFLNKYLNLTVQN